MSLKLSSTNEMQGFNYPFQLTRIYKHITELTAGLPISVSFT